MRPKYILRSGEVGIEPEAWILGIYFTQNKKNRNRGALTIGGPAKFRDNISEVLASYFAITDGIEDKRAKERSEGLERRRVVFDVGPMTFVWFLRGIRRLRASGVNAVRVRSTGRLMR